MLVSREDMLAVITAGTSFEHHSEFLTAFVITWLTRRVG